MRATGAIFFSSFAIFALFAYAPLFIQGAQLRSPMEVGMMMLSLSLGWSLGAAALGLFIDRVGHRPCAVAGGVLLVIGSVMTLLATVTSTAFYLFSSFFIVGVGMGFVSLATLMVVQTGLDRQDLGVATSSHQFFRALGGTVGVGICGGVVAGRFAELAKSVRLPEGLDEGWGGLGETEVGAIEQLLQPHVQAIMPDELKRIVQEAVMGGVGDVFWAVALSALVCLVFCMLLPRASEDGYM